jgi:molybdenum cofactor cytidylyltransferase
MALALRDGGADQVIVVVAPGDTGDAIANAIADLPRVITIVNPTPKHGMLSSVQAGIREAGKNLPNVQGWLVCPCDLPLLKPAHVAVVVDAWVGDSHSIVAPTFGGKRGHPTLFGNFWTAEILEMDSTQVGLNALLAAHPTAIREVSVEDAAIVRDADTPEEWQALLERLEL